MISADFVLSGDERVNDTFAFSVFRYDRDDFADVLSEARQAIPHDLKKVKSIQRAALDYLSSRERFHFCFLPDRSRHAASSVEDARFTIEQTIASIKEWDNYPSKQDFLKVFLSLRQEAQRKKFPYELLNDVITLSALASSIAFYIAKHSDPEIITWFIDRDKMTTAFRGIASWAMTANFASLCSQNGMRSQRVTLGSAVDLVATNGKEAWFDDLVRPADYIAGAMARWDIRNDAILSSSEKVIQLVDTVIGENPHVALAYLHFGVLGARSSNIRVFRKEGTNRKAYVPTKQLYLDYLTSQATRDWTRRRPTMRSVALQHTGYTPTSMRLP